MRCCGCDKPLKRQPAGRFASKERKLHLGHFCGLRCFRIYILGGVA